jgi:hypothetical protein
VRRRIERRIRPHVRPRSQDFGEPGLDRHGSYTLPPGAGGIQSSQAGFVEWYPSNGGEPPNHCARLPYQKTFFGTPRTTHTGSIGTQSLSCEYGNCVGQVAFYTEKVSGGVENNCGFRGAAGLVGNVFDNSY